MGTDALPGLLISGQGGEIWVFDYLEFMLLVFIEEAVEGGRGEGECFGD